MKLILRSVRIAVIYLLISITADQAYTQVSAAREWNEILLEAIRNDYARPTVHARNLYHHSIMVYDAWAAYNTAKEKYLIGDTLGSYISNFNEISIPIDIEAARHETISYASFYFIKHRYQNSPDYNTTYLLMYNYMVDHGYSVDDANTDYQDGGAAALGNYIAQELINYGYTDGSNELLNFENSFYSPINPPLVMSEEGNPNLIDPNRWQALTLDSNVDQSGNEVEQTLPFLSPEWGNVSPFALSQSMSSQKFRDENWYTVYFDSLKPAKLNVNDNASWESFYKWNHSLVSIWQSHLDPNDGVEWDISPASMGNNSFYPHDSSEYSTFYNLDNGGDPSQGYTLNPVTGEPYTPQLVPRGDYTRVLAEFWADGLDSETPPGHWFEIYHYVTDQALFERKWQGQGPTLDALEYDVKAHLALGGAMHDAAISAWSLKGYHDYIRPVSSIRYLAANGQSSDPLLPNYHPNGIPLLIDYIELIDSLDPLAGINHENVGKIKLFTWKGHDYINDPQVDVAGSGWILGENWWPYQRPTFVTPPFSGFVSGHSTFSRAAAGILEYISGSPYFPGGLGEFFAEQNEFLQFENGPSVPITLQWASYQDAADQCSLSRIWGGIHPPIDDIPGRSIGTTIGEICFEKADSIFSIENPALISVTIGDTLINSFDMGSIVLIDCQFNSNMNMSEAPFVSIAPETLNNFFDILNITWIDTMHLQIQLMAGTESIEELSSQIIIHGLNSSNGWTPDSIVLENHLIVDTKLPNLTSLEIDHELINDETSDSGISILFSLSEPCNIEISPQINLSGENYLNESIEIASNYSNWLNPSSYLAYFNTYDYNEEVPTINIQINEIKDIHGNPLSNPIHEDRLSIDTKNPFLELVSVSDSVINLENVTSNTQFTTAIKFNESMDTTILPLISFFNEDNQYSNLVMNSFQAHWIDSNLFEAEIWVLPNNNDLIELELVCTGAIDLFGNNTIDSSYLTILKSDMKSPNVLNLESPATIIYDGMATGDENYYIDITFNEPMNTGSNPLVVHQNEYNLNNSIQYNINESFFLDSLRYRAIFQVMDENIEINNIDIQVSFAEDAARNPQEIFHQSSFVSLDTKNPSIIDYSINTTLLNFENTLDLAILFDEPMGPSIIPQLNFYPLASPPLEIEQMSFDWINNDSINLSYQLMGASPEASIYSMGLENGIDNAGNLLTPITLNDSLTIEEALQLEQVTKNKSILFPNIIGSGSNIYFRNEHNDEQYKTCLLRNTEGKLLQELTLEYNNGIGVSEPIDVSPGMYFIYLNEKSYRLIVL